MNEYKMKLVGVDLLERVYGKWWLMLLEGLCLIALCAMTFVNSEVTLALFIFVLGVYRGIMGVVYIISSLIIRHKYGSNVGFSLGRGLFDLVVCAVFLLAPNVVITFFIIIIGIWAILTGIFLLVISGNFSGLGRFIQTVIGIALIAFGIYAFFDPLGQANIFVLILGLVLGIFGLFLVIQSIKMKKFYSKIKLENKGYDDYRIE